MKRSAGSSRYMGVDVTCRELWDGSDQRLLSGVIVKRRNSWLLTAAALAPLSFGFSEPVLAACTGVFDVTCGPASNPYPTGINLNSNNIPLTLTLEPGVIVTIPAGAGVSDAVNAANSTASGVFGADVTLTANDANVTNNNNPSSNNVTGLRIQAAGDATITGSGRIDVAGTASDWAILAITEGVNPSRKNVTVTYGGPGARGLARPEREPQRKRIGRHTGG